MEYMCVCVYLLITHTETIWSAQCTNTYLKFNKRTRHEFLIRPNLPLCFIRFVSNEVYWRCVILLIAFTITLNKQHDGKEILIGKLQRFTCTVERSPLTWSKSSYSNDIYYANADTRIQPKRIVTSPKKFVFVGKARKVIKLKRVRNSS